TNAQRVRLKLSFLHNLQHRQSNRARDIVTAKGAEKLHAVIKRSGDCARGNHCANRVSIANRLAEDYDVRHHAVLLERVEMCADTSVTRLHFIGNANSSRR